MNDLYSWIKLLHILAAIVWIGGAIVIQVLAIRAVGRDDPAEIARFAGEAEWVGLRVFMPASVLVLLAGSYLTWDGPWRLADPWVGAGLGLYALSFLTGMGFLGPEAGRISKLTAEHGAEHPEVQRRLKRIFLVSRIELVWLVAIVALMVLKPM